MFTPWQGVLPLDPQPTSWAPSLHSCSCTLSPYPNSEMKRKKRKRKIALSCVQLLQSHELESTRLLCPWNSPGKNPGVDCHSLLQGIFPTWRLNPGCLNCRQILYHLSYQGSPLYDYMPTKNLLSIFIGLFYY